MQPSRKVRRVTLPRSAETPMAHSIQSAFEPWTFPVALDLVLILDAFLYFRGWIRLCIARVNIIPTWRAGSFVLGLFLFWEALVSPLSALKEHLPTVHMIQHF